MDFKQPELFEPVSIFSTDNIEEATVPINVTILLTPLVAAFVEDVRKHHGCDESALYSFFVVRGITSFIESLQEDGTINQIDALRNMIPGLLSKLEVVEPDARDGQST